MACLSKSEKGSFYKNRKGYLGDNVLSIFLAVEEELETNVLEGDARVRERHHADTSLDDVVSKTFVLNRVSNEHEALLLAITAKRGSKSCQP